MSPILKQEQALMGLPGGVPRRNAKRARSMLVISHSVHAHVLPSSLYRVSPRTAIQRRLTESKPKSLALHLSHRRSSASLVRRGVRR